jgi:hypothetical protein
MRKKNNPGAARVHCTMVNNIGELVEPSKNWI